MGIISTIRSQCKCRTAVPVVFSFTIPVRSIVSLGVYNGEVLVKTLLSVVEKEAGAHIILWDGTNSDGETVPIDNYTATVLHYPVDGGIVYTWEGVVGNISDSFDVAGLYHSYSGIYNMAVTGTNLYMARGYNEQGTSSIKTTAGNLQQCTPILAKGCDNFYNCADSTKVYWGGIDANDGNNHWVYATKISDNTQFTFSTGAAQATVNGMAYSSAIDKIVNGNGAITGMAVQQTGNYLFVSHGGLNQLHVLHKVTGALVQTLSITNPRQLAVDDADSLWMISGTNTVAKYTVNSNGNLSVAVLTLSVSAPIAIAAKGSVVLVADNTTQTVKGFNNTTGIAGTDLGLAGGYANDATVTDYKFYWRDLRESLGTFIAFEPDGSFWVGDRGNCRAQKYNSSFVWVDRIMYLRNSYSASVDPNNISRVFSDYLEFNVDYTKPIGGVNGSWALVKNWGAVVPATADDQYKRLTDVATLSNGRTYATFAKPGALREVVELPSTGVLRFTGVTFPGDNRQLYPDGSLRFAPQYVAGAVGQWLKYSLTGFVSNNPTWGSAEVVATSPAMVAKDPYYKGDQNKLTSGEYTATGKVITFTAQNTDGYHVGAINFGQNSFVWKTAKSTFIDYAGDFPAADRFDIGNGVNQNAGTKLRVLDNHVFWHYGGEFWKNSQTNMFTHLYENGLPLGQFGAIGSPGDFTPRPGMAGNGLNQRVVKDNASAFYIYHNDESFHSGVHRWKITGLNTINQQTITLTTTFLRKNEDVLTGLDLLASLPNRSVITSGNGITRFPETENLADRFANYWSVRTSVKSYLKPDLYIQFNKPVTGYRVDIDMGTVNSTDWVLNSKVRYDGYVLNSPSGGAGNATQFFDVLDAAGKVIARFYGQTNWAATPFGGIIFNNSVSIYTSTETDVKNIMYGSKALRIRVNGSGVTMAYADFDPVNAPLFDAAADWQHPKTIRFSFNWISGNLYGRTLGVEKLRLIV